MQARERNIHPKKKAYREKVIKLVSEYSKVFVVKADNVGSNQFHQIRRSLRGKAVVLMGKNTQIRTALDIAIKSNTNLRQLKEEVVENVGLVFTDHDLIQIRDLLLSNRVEAPAKAGSIAPVPVVVPAGNTGLEPTMTSFFQALNIPTKITKGTVDIQQDVLLLEAGDKVGSSEAALLQKLGIKPFTYGLEVVSIYDNGSVFTPEILDVTQQDMENYFQFAVDEIAAISLATDTPTIAAVPHSIINGYKNVLAVSLATSYTFPLAAKIKEILENPEALAAALAAAAPAAGASSAAVAAEAEPEPEPEEEDDDMGFSLFD